MDAKDWMPMVISSFALAISGWTAMSNFFQGRRERTPIVMITQIGGADRGFRLRFLFLNKKYAAATVESITLHNLQDCSLRSLPTMASTVLPPLTRTISVGPTREVDELMIPKRGGKPIPVGGQHEVTLDLVVPQAAAMPPQATFDVKITLHDNRDTAVKVRRTFKF
jgi:hypothetical protein